MIHFKNRIDKITSIYLCVFFKLKIEKKYIFRIAIYRSQALGWDGMEQGRKGSTTENYFLVP